MSGRGTFTRDEERRLSERIREGEIPPCPRCGGALSARDVPPRREVAYVRHRVWLVCEGCGRSAVLDRRRAGG